MTVTPRMVSATVALMKFRPHPKQAEFMREPPRRIAFAGTGRPSAGKARVRVNYGGLMIGDRTRPDEFIDVTPEQYERLANRAKARKD
jgi:hypothetical protein